MSSSTLDYESSVNTESPSTWKRLSSANTLWTGLVLLVLYVVFSALRPDAFLTLFTFQTLLIEASVLLVLTVGMTYVIITSGIDLSVGSVLVFAGVVGAQVMEALSPGGDATNAGGGVILVGLLATVVAGGAWGLLNGGSDVRTRARGAARLAGLRPDCGRARTWSSSRPWSPCTAHGCCAPRASAATTTLGSSPEAERRVGINVTGHLVATYAYVGALAGLAGFMSLAYFGTTTISAHSADNLNAIAAVVIGGTSLRGGVGTVLGSVIGVFIPAVLTKGFVVIGVQPYWQPIAVSIVLVAAVWLDQVRRRARNSR